MECNKDEAVRAKGIAEKKLLERDITGAKKFALKAQSLFPELDGLSQFLVIIDVYVAHDMKINGELDYYGIFGVDRFADEQVLKKQYKRMALSLHPDKNKSVEADGAFKIMSQAWSVLSDKDKRNAYNLKLNTRASNHTSSTFTSMYKAAATNPQNVPTRPQTPSTATKPESVPTPRPHTSSTTTKPKSVPIPQPHTPRTSSRPNTVPTRPQTPRTATKTESVPTPRPHTFGTTTMPKSVPIQQPHIPRTSTRPNSVPTRPQTRSTTTKRESVPTRPHTLGPTTKPKSIPTLQPHTPGTSTRPKSVTTQTHTPRTATRPMSVPTQSPGTSTRLKSVPTQSPGTSTRLKSVPTQPHTPVAATKPKSVPTRLHTPGAATNTKICPCYRMSNINSVAPGLATRTCEVASCMASISRLKRKIEKLEQDIAMEFRDHIKKSRAVP